MYICRKQDLVFDILWNYYNLHEMWYGVRIKRKLNKNGFLARLESDACHMAWGSTPQASAKKYLTFHLWRGRKHTQETKDKMSKTHKANNDQSGEKNSQFGTCWITNGVENKKIKKEDINIFLNKGWSKGRKMNTEKWQSGLLHMSWKHAGVMSAPSVRIRPSPQIIVRLCFKLTVTM